MPLPPTADLTSPTFIGELLAALAAQLDLESYLSARAAGLSDSEIRTASAQDYPLDSYTAARVTGATPSQLTQVYGLADHSAPATASRSTSRVFRLYAETLAAGASHPEFVQILCRGTDLGGYQAARLAGGSHSEVLEIADLLGNSQYTQGPLTLYAGMRASGISHAEYKDASVHVESLIDYAQSRTTGQDHRGALNRCAAQVATLTL